MVQSVYMEQNYRYMLEVELTTVINPGALVWTWFDTKVIMLCFCKISDIQDKKINKYKNTKQLNLCRWRRVDLQNLKGDHAFEFFFSYI